MNETWKKTEINPDYEVSDAGRVRSTTRPVRCHTDSIRVMNGRVLKATLKKETGYLQVRVGGENIKTVHTLVAKAFCDGYSNGLVVNHKNGIKTDNRAENLEWVTTAENLSHAYRELGIPGSCLGRFGEAHPTSKSVIAICTKTGKTRRYGSAMDAVREGFDSSSISRCCSGERSSHKGFAWKFEELAA